MVDAELRESEAAEGGSQTGRGTKRRLGHDQGDEITDDRGPQKRRHGDQISLFSDGSAGSPRPAREPSNHSRRDDTDDERPPKRLLKTRSGGISKTTPRNQRVTYRNTRGPAITPAQASTSDHGPNGQRARLMCLTIPATPAEGLPETRLSLA